MVNRVFEFLESTDEPRNALAKRLTELQNALETAAKMPEFFKDMSVTEKGIEAEHYRNLAFFTGLLKGAAEKTDVVIHGDKVRFAHKITLSPALKKRLLLDTDVTLYEEVRNNFSDEFFSTNLADQIASFVSALKDKYVFHPHTR